MHDPFDEIRHSVHRLLEGQSFRPAHGSAEWRPQVDVYETDDAVIVVVEVAGVVPEEIDINVDGRRLYIRGSRTPAPRTGTRRIHHLEIPHGEFHMAVDLPAAVDASRTEAISRNGLLEIQLPVARAFHPTVRTSDSAGRERA